MLKKIMTYVDYDGTERTEDFYFHLNESDLVTWSAETMGLGLEDHLKFIIASGDPVEILAAFQRLIQMSIGMKTPDGRSFIQNDEIRLAFMSTNAYQDLFMELMTSPAKAAEFVNGIVPNRTRKNVDARNEPREYTREELLSMDDTQFRSIVGEPKNMSKEHLMIAYERNTRVPS